mmetsp:Transcript_9417/g.31300  ORF Transcript_9417/g.31300 Transcript_9417/m.31300 type:complete len:306 (+) Transcript_9417:918-1835(+)
MARNRFRSFSTSSFFCCSRSAMTFLSLSAWCFSSCFLRAASSRTATRRASAFCFATAASSYFRTRAISISFATRAAAASPFFCSNSLTASFRVRSRACSSVFRTKSCVFASAAATTRRCLSRSVDSRLESSMIFFDETTASVRSRSSSASRAARSFASVSRSTATLFSSRILASFNRADASPCRIFIAFTFKSRVFASSAKPSSYSFIADVSVLKASSSSFSSRRRSTTCLVSASRFCVRDAICAFSFSFLVLASAMSFSIALLVAKTLCASSISNFVCALWRFSRNTRFARATSANFTLRSSSR